MAVPSLLPGGAPPAVTPGTTKTPLLLPGPAAKPFRSRATACHEERSLCGRCVAGCRGRAPPRTRVVRRVHEASCQRGPTPRPPRAGEKAKGTARPRMFRRNPHGGRCTPTRPSCRQPCTQTRGWAGGLHVPRYPLRYRVSPARPRARSPAPCICPGHSRCPTPKLSPRPRERCSSQRLCHRRTVTWKSRKRERRLGAEPGGSPLLTPRS